MMTVEFRQDGSLVRRHYKNPPPHPESTSFYEYDKDSDRLVAERVEQDGKVTVARRLEYDSAGRLLRVIVPDKDGEQRIAETWNYDPDGKKHKVTHIKLDIPVGVGECGVFIGVEGSELGFGMPGAATITSNYDLHHRPTEHLVHDSGGELLSRIDLVFDDRGNLIEEICIHQKLPAEITAQCTNAEQLETIRRLFTFGRRHRYDDQNRRIETSTIMQADDRESRIFAYNDHGDVVSETSDTSHSEYSVGEAGELMTKPDSTRAHLSETHFRYQYDTRGNWIEKIVETLDGRVWSIERRTIRYFDDTP